MNLCKQCNRKLTTDEVALHKKLVNRNATEFLCINCCAAYFEVNKSLLEKKIIEFKEMGCTLFLNKTNWDATSNTKHSNL